MRSLLPEVPALFGAARSEGEIWRTLESVLARGAIAAAELVAVSETGEDHEIRRWSVPPPADHGPENVSARFPLGPDALARAELRFRWHSDDGQVSPQTEVLIQVVVDIVARSLARVGSNFAPRPVEAPDVRGEPRSAPAFHVRS